MSTKECLRFFLFFLDLELVINLVSLTMLKPGLFLFLQMDSIAVGARQFFRQNTWFLKNKRAWSKFFIEFCIT